MVTTNGLIGAKYSLINGKLYQTIGKINLNEIKNWNKIKKSSWWVNGNFQVQGDNRDAKHFSYNFITKNTGDGLNFKLRLIDDENKEIKFEDKEKNFLSWQFKKRDKAIQEYVRHLKLTKQEYQKLFQENKLLKEIINSTEKEKIVKTNCKKKTM